MARVKEEVKSKEFVTKWIQQLYDTTTINEDELRKIYEEIKYVGYNREETLELLSKFDKKLVVEMILMCAVRGPQKAATIKLSNGKSFQELGIPASGLKSKKGLSINRISPSTADLAAYFMKKLQVPKRMESELPAWLQFPTSGSIRMPKKYRDLHREFAKKFSERIGGEFNDQIYLAMEQNSYLNDNLHLFDDMP